MAQEPAYAGPSEAATTIPPTNTLLNSCISAWGSRVCPTQAWPSDFPGVAGHCDTAAQPPLVHLSTAALGRDHLCILPAVSAGQERPWHPHPSKPNHHDPTLRKTPVQPYPTTPTGSRAVPNHAGPPLFTLHDPLGPPTLPQDILPCPDGESAERGCLACQGLPTHGQRASGAVCVFQCVCMY